MGDHTSIDYQGRFSTSALTGHIQTSCRSRERSRMRQTGPWSLLGYLPVPGFGGIWSCGTPWRRGTGGTPWSEPRPGAAAAPWRFPKGFFNFPVLFIAPLHRQLPLRGTFPLLAAALPDPRLGGSPARRRTQSPLSTTLIISGFP